MVEKMISLMKKLMRWSRVYIASAILILDNIR